MNVFFFGDSARPLFGLHHPAAGRARPVGVVICNPFGQEALRAHRALRELATRLSRDGFHVLRFDYHGCGDSGGASDAGRVDQWLQDVGSAVAELREVSGVPATALIGLRLGGTLAAQWAHSAGGVDRLVLWDAITDGTAYLDELRAAHADWAGDHAPGARLQSDDEALGFPLPAELRAGIAGLRLEIPTGDPKVLAIDHRNYAGAQVWRHDDGVDRTLVPRAVLDAIAGWLGEPRP